MRRAHAGCFTSPSVDAAAGVVIEGLGAGLVPRARLRRRDRGAGSAPTPPIERVTTGSVRSASPARSPTCTGRSSATGRSMGGWMARAQTLLGGDTTRQKPGGSRSTSACSKPTGPSERSASARRSRWRDAPATAISSSSRSPTSAPASCTTTAPRRAWCCSTRRSPRSPAARSTTSACSQEIFCQLFSACEHAHDVSPRRPVDPGRRGDRRAAQLPGGVGVLPHALRRRAHRRRPLARGRRRAHRGGAAVGARATAGFAAARWSASPTSASARAGSRRPSSCSTVSTGDVEARPPAGGDPPGTGRDGARQRHRSSGALGRARSARHRCRAAARAARRRPPRERPARRGGRRRRQPRRLCAAGTRATT